jgi:hypothetical protein
MSIKTKQRGTWDIQGCDGKTSSNIPLIISYKFLNELVVTPFIVAF